MATRKNYFVCLFILIVITAASYSVKANSDGESSIQTVLNFWEEQDAEFVLGPQKNVVLTLGVSGNGKTTVTLFLTGANLEAVNNGNEINIIDKNDKIGNETHQPKTNFPDLMIDPEEDVAFYDCPGFKDSNEPQFEISNSYFLNKLFNYANKLKFVFIVDHSAINKTANQDRIIRLFAQAFKIIPNIEEFKDGVGMVVTNVDSPKSHDEIINAIASELQTIRKELQIKEKKTNIDPEKLKLITGLINCINVLLIQEDISNKKRGTVKVYKRIGLFRVPEKVGKINEMIRYKDAKVKLKELIHKRLQYVPNMNTNFGFTLSAKSQNCISNLLDELMEKHLESDFKKICIEIKQHYWSKEKHLQDLSLIYKLLEEGVKELSGTNLNQIAPKILKEIIGKVNQLNIGISPEILERISKHFDYINFLLKVSNREWKTSNAVTNKVAETVLRLEHSQKWYRFIVLLLNELSKHYFQNSNDKNIALKFCHAFPDKFSEQKSVKIVELGLSSLFNKLNLNNNNNHNLFDENWTINKYELRALKNVLVNAYDNNFTAICTGNNTYKKLIVKGYNFRLSSVIMKSKCWDSAKFIEIIALNTLIFDKSIEKVGQKAIITIIAPRWEILNHVEINLNGKSGDDYNSAAAISKSGKPGAPGGSGGIFFGLGIVLLFTSENNTLFFADGGNGGKGQDGGTGSPGCRGHSPTKDYCQNSPVLDHHAINSTFWIDELGHRWDYDATTSVYTISATEPVPPGKGGDGGAGGKPGRAGYVYWIDLDGPSDNFKKIETKQGKYGPAGKGGSGGIGFENEASVLIVAKGLFRPHNTIIRTETGKKIPSGANGIDGANHDGIRDPEGPLVVSFPSNSLNEFRKLVREHLVGNVRESELRYMIAKLDEHAIIQTCLYPIDLVNELKGLEDQFFKLQSKLSFVPFYESFVHRVKILSTLDYIKESNSHKRVLSYLYSAALSKLRSIKRKKVYKNTVINLDNSLNIAIKHIKELKETKKQGAINTYRKEYNDQLKKKINDARNYIEDQVTPAIHEYFDQIDKNIDKLIEENVELQKETNKQLAKSKEVEAKLQKQILIKKILSGVKILITVLSVIGSAAELGGKILDIGVTIIETLVIDDSKDSQIVDPADLPAGVINALKEWRSEAAKPILQKYDDIDKYFKEHEVPEFDQDVVSFLTRAKLLYSKIGILKEQGSKLMYSDEYIKIFVSVNKELISESKSLINGLKKNATQIKKKNGEKKYKAVLDALQYVIDVLTTSDEIYSQVRDGPGKLEAGAAASEKLESNLGMLHEYDEFVNQVLNPKVVQLEEFFEKIAKGLDGKSHVDLDISKWKLQVTLRDVQIFYKKMVSGSGVEADLMRCIDKLDEGMTTLIDVYDRIDTYSDHANFASYNADLYLIASDKTQNDETIKDLQQIILSNVILERYELSMQSLKQRYFPLAQVFLETYELFENQTTDKSIDLANYAIHQIKDLRLKIQDKKTALQEYSNNFYSHTKFNSHSIDAPEPSFYKWEYKSIKNEIGKLLDGNEITLKADITKGLPYSAVKFKTIMICLRTKNKDQQLLNDAFYQLYVNMKMVSNQYYRCANNLYSIPLDEKIEIGYKLDSNGELNNPSDAYHLISENEPALSPYTTWMIKLNGTAKQLKALSKFKNSPIDLELIGTGGFAKGKSFERKYCQNNLNDYYDVYKPISDGNAAFLIPFNNDINQRN